MKRIKGPKRITQVADMRDVHAAAEWLAHIAGRQYSVYPSGQWRNVEGRPLPSYDLAQMNSKRKA